MFKDISSGEFKNSQPLVVYAEKEYRLIRLLRDSSLSKSCLKEFENKIPEFQLSEVFVKHIDLTNTVLEDIDFSQFFLGQVDFS